jgi:hypothetical protein
MTQCHVRIEHNLIIGGAVWGAFKYKEKKPCNTLRYRYGFLGSTRVGIILWPWPLGDACYQGIPYVPGKKKKKKATKVPR